MGVDSQASSDGQFTSKTERVAKRKWEWEVAVEQMTAHDLHELYTTVFDQSSAGVPDLEPKIRGVLVDPEGNRHTIYDKYGASAKFARKHGLSKSEMCKLLRGKV